MMILRNLLWAAALVSAAAQLHAHDFWMEPSSFRPAVGEHVAVSLLVGENLEGQLVQPRPDRIERFVAVQGERETPIGEELEVANNSMIRVIYRSRPNFVTLNAAKFEQYLREEGLERIISLRAQRGQSLEEGREIYSRCAKSLLVPRDSSRRENDRPYGLTLEIIAERNSFLVQYNGRPLEGALVVAINASDRAALRARTDSAGRVTFPIETPGLWLIKTVHMIEAPKGSGADWESLWASLTFER